MASEFFKGKKILITGGAGFIGSSLAIELVKRGSKVAIVDAMLPLYGGNLFNLESVKNDIEFIEGDIRNKELMDKLVAGKDIIFDFAAQVSYIDSKDLPFLDLDINALGHLNVLEAVRQHAPGATVLFASSRMVYGKILTNPVKEDHPTEPLSLYGIHKLLGEKYLQYYSKTFGIRTIAVRIPNPYGPRQQMKHSKYSIVGWFLRQAMEGKTIKIFGDGRQDRDYIYIDDIVDAFLRLAEKGVSGEVYNLGTHEKTQFVDMVGTVIAEAGYGGKEFVPWPANYEKNETGGYYADISKIQTETNWSPKINLAEGIRCMASYYQKYQDNYWKKDMMDDSDMRQMAEEYMLKRFPKATKKEQEKVISDWMSKSDRGKYIVADFKKRIADSRGMKILDYGSGQGGTSLAFSEAGANVTGIDIESELVRISSVLVSGKNNPPTFSLYDGSTIPFPDNSFDAVISISVLEHVDDPVKYLREALRVLKKGGSLYLAFPNRLWPKETHTGLFFVSYFSRNIADMIVRLFSRNPLAENNLHFYGLFAVKRYLRQACIGNSEWIIKEESGESLSPIKKTIKKILALASISYKAFLPHISLIVNKK